MMTALSSPSPNQPKSGLKWTLHMHLYNITNPPSIADQRKGLLLFAKPRTSRSSIRQILPPESVFDTGHPRASHRLCQGRRHRECHSRQYCNPVRTSNTSVARRWPRIADKLGYSRILCPVDSILLLRAESKEASSSGQQLAISLARHLAVFVGTLSTRSSSPRSSARGTERCHSWASV